MTLKNKLRLFFGLPIKFDCIQKERKYELLRAFQNTKPGAVIPCETDEEIRWFGSDDFNKMRKNL